MEEAERLAERSAVAMWAADSASQGLGMEFQHVRPGEAQFAMVVQERMLNGHGICHGGFVFALADTAFAFACNSHNRRTVAQSCTIAFLHPTRLGDRLVATARELAVSGRSALYDVRVQVGERVVAEFRGQSREIGGTVAS